MIKQIKFVKTAIAAAALGLVAVSAQAAVVSVTPITYASELFGGTAPGTAITAPTINVVAASAIPANSTFTVMIKLVGAKFAADVTATNPAGAAAATIYSTTQTNAANVARVFGTTQAGATAAGVGAGTATATTNNADVIALQVTTSDTGIGIGGTVATLQLPQISASGLAVSGATVSAIGAVYIGVVAPPVGSDLSSTGTLETISTSAKVADAAPAVTITLATADNDQKIDAAGNASKTFTTGGAAAAADTGSATVVRLGTITVKDSGAKDATGAANYTVASTRNAADRVTNVTVTGAAGYFAALGTTGTLSVVNGAAGLACVGASTASATFASNAAAAAATSVTIPSAPLTASAAGVSHDLCMTVDGNIAIASGATTGAGTLSVAAARAQDSAVSSTSASLNSLAPNGTTLYVSNYWPKSLNEDAAGKFGTYLRITNTGNVGAQVSAAYINPTTGVVGTAAVIPLAGFSGNILPAGASILVPSSVVEGAVGTAPFGYKAGRIVLTAPTSSLRAQTFIQTTGVAPQLTGDYSNATSTINGANISPAQQ